MDLEYDNPNYAATVVIIRQLIPLEGLDNLVAAPLLGYQALVSKDILPGEWGILFTAETQLSEEFARVNNLHRHSHLNEDESAKGYLEDNRRVKALKFRGHRSDALFMPLDSLSDFTINVTLLKEGEMFDRDADGRRICQKYERPRKAQHVRQLPKVHSRVDKKFLPEHFDTVNLFKNPNLLRIGDPVIVTQKLHGTSIRIGHTLVSRSLPWWEKLAKRLGVKVQEFEYDYVYGSRKVIKDPNNPNQQHFYGSDLWTLEGEKLKGLLPKGMVVYGELVGWTPEFTPIQQGYTYGIDKGHRELFVYRITQVNPDGRVIDLSWDQVVEFCQSVGLKHVPVLWAHRLWYSEDEIASLLDKRFASLGYPNVLPVDKGKVDEGVCVRREGLTPLILKAKSPIFLQHETRMLDKEVQDIEEEQSGT